MREQAVNFVKLGVFVLSGLSLLILTLYIVGRNQSLFGSGLELQTRFRAVNGLVTGNNVRYAGIEVGTVRRIELLNDTVVEVTMSLEEKMKTIIRANAVTRLGTDGLIGKRVINILPGNGPAPFVQGGDVLLSKQEIDTEEMLETLHHTNRNMAVISDQILVTLNRLNSSVWLTELVNDRSIPANLRASLAHLHETTEKASLLMTEATSTLALASHGKGTLATLLTDTTLSEELQQAVRQIKNVEASAEKLAVDLDQVVLSLGEDFNRGPGTVNALMKDSLMAAELRQTIGNVEKGTAAFHQNMKALKHNFLFRRYFKKLEKKAKKSGVQPE
jgi:phospholipid/cholesterol/gamma-HCH transport system substrate-binding protein